MGSMNLLGFSLSSPQQHHHPSAAATHEEDHSSHETSRFGLFNPDAAGDCFDLTTTTTTTSDHHSTTTAQYSLNHHLPPFGIYEAFHRNNNNNIQDWKQENEYNSQNFLLPTSCNNHQQQQPKLENFLGGHSFGDHHSSTYGGNSASADHYMIHPNCTSLQLPPQPEEATVGGGGDGGTGNTTNSIGLSMIKTWLRNQPPHSAENNNNTESGGGGSGGAARVQQTLSLSMSTGSQSSSSLPLLTANNVSGESSSSENKQPPPTTAAALDSNQTGGAIVDSSIVPRKAIDTFGQRTSIYRGVTRHRWTGRYEAHLWDNSCRREGQTRKGRQVYLGGYDKEEKAARAYDLAALKYWGTTTTTNFPISHYEKELEEMKHMTRQEYVASLRRKSSGFSRGASIYRGVTRHHQHGRWQARIGRVAGNKDLYLGTFSTQEEAAEAYDVAAIKFRGLSAVTNFDMSRYDVKSILESSTLPIGGAAKRLKEMDHQLVEPLISVVDHGSHTTDQDQDSMSMSTNSHLSTEGILNNYHHGWHHHHHHALAAFPQQSHPLTMHYPYGTQTHQRLWCKQEQDPDHTTFPDHNIHHEQQLQLGNNNNNTHNFFLSNSAGGLHSSLMSMDHSASSMDNSSASNSVSVYGGGDGSNGTYGGSGGGYVIPTVIANDGGNQNQRSNGYGDSDQLKAFGSYESVFGSATDPYHAAHARNNNYLYNYQHQSSVVDAVNKGSSTYDWVPTAIPTLAAPSRPNSNMSLCPPPFTILHE